MERRRGFIIHTSGSALLEFAFTLPIQIALFLGVIEFGHYMLNAQQSNRLFGNIAQAIGFDPANPRIRELAVQSGLDLEVVDAETNFLCAKSYPTYEAAKTGGCEDMTWQTERPEESSPDGVNSYYVALSMQREQKSLSGLFDSVIPSIHGDDIILVTDKSTGSSDTTNNTSTSTSTTSHTNSFSIDPSDVDYYAMTCRSAGGRAKTFISASVQVSSEAGDGAWLATDAPLGQSVWLIQINKSTGSPLKMLNCFEAGQGSPTFNGDSDCLAYGQAMGQPLNGTGRPLKSCSPAFIIGGSIPG